MNFAPTRPRRRTAENIVPMINIVFLLLIFFLINAQIAPPAPFDVTPPVASSELPPEEDTLYVSAEGQIAYEGALDEAAWEALRARDASARLAIRADSTLRAADFAALLPKLAAVGVRDTALVTGAR